MSMKKIKLSNLVFNQPTLENCKVCGKPTPYFEMFVTPTTHLRVCYDCYAKNYALKKPKPRTNFDRITESEQAFVKWVLDNYYSVPKFFPCETKCNGDCEECFIEWLNKEIEE